MTQAEGTFTIDRTDEDEVLGATTWTTHADSGSGELRSLRREGTPQLASPDGHPVTLAYDR